MCVTVSKILCGASRYPPETVKLLDSTPPLLEDTLIFGRGTPTWFLDPLHVIVIDCKAVNFHYEMGEIPYLLIAFCILAK